MKVTFPVMSYISSSEKKARKKIKAYMGFFFFFFFRLITAKISFVFILYPPFKYMTFIYSQPFKTNKVEKVNKYTKNTRNKLLFTYRTIGNI